MRPHLGELPQYAFEMLHMLSLYLDKETYSAESVTHAHARIDQALADGYIDSRQHESIKKYLYLL